MMTSRESPYSKYLKQANTKGLLRELKPCLHPTSGYITYQGKDFVNFSTNDYLGLSQRSELINRAKEYADQYGVGAIASRLVTGNLSPFDMIEARVSKLKGQEASLIMVSGFQTNAAVLQAIFDKTVLKASPLVFADRLNHASMHFGCAAAHVRQIRYRHLDLDHLESLLKKHEHESAPKYILTESVFSMDGDIVPMDDICRLAQNYNCTVICDDAHATGVLGDKGKGLSGNADIVIGTFSKALGSMGGYVTGSQTVIDYLINRCGGLIYSTGISPVVLGAIDAALELLPELDPEREKVADIAQSFRNKIISLGLDVCGSQTQIVPSCYRRSDKGTCIK